MKKKTAPVLLTEFIEGMNQAEGAAGQLIHHFRNPGWITIRDHLSRIKDRCVGLAVKGTQGSSDAKFH